MRLFQVLDTSTRKAEPTTFQDKTTAKAARNALNRLAGHPWRYIVTPGPDHRNFTSATRREGAQK